MPFFDRPLHELQNYLPQVHEPGNFDRFWQDTLEDARRYPLDPVFEVHDAGLKVIDCYDVTFSGYNGQRIKGWYLRPAATTSPLPCVVEYLGYGGGRGFPFEWLVWPASGYAFFVMDTRGQGSGMSSGVTPDIADEVNPHPPGFMTQGILNPQQYYYRRLFTDAVRAVETVRSREDVDTARIAVTGNSQGGGIAIAVAGLVSDIAMCMPGVPFLCHFRHGIGKASSGPYLEIVRYLFSHRDDVELVLNTLDYFDGINFATRIQARSLFSVGLMDTICPPSTVFAAYNHIQAPKHIAVYPYNEHEGGGGYFIEEKRRFMATITHSPPAMIS